jgi:pyrimidine deaminase RibD-like protein
MAEDARQLMELAVEEASKSEAARTGDPRVGAVVARKSSGESYTFLVAGCRSRDQKTGDAIHAEVDALGKLDPGVARGTTVFTTLEPCTSRRQVHACTHQLLYHAVSEVFFAMLDPNRDIRGTGIWLLQENNIRVGMFAPDLARKAWELNREFIEYELGLGIAISEPTASAEVPSGKRFALKGSFRTKPRTEDRVFVFNRAGDLFYPQSPPIWSTPSARLWTCGVIVGAPGEYELVVASLSEDIDALQRYYSQVHKEVTDGLSIVESSDAAVQSLKKEVTRRAWVGIPELNKLPGFKPLASVRVTAV